MTGKKYGWLVVIVGIIAVIVCVMGYYMLRVKQKAEFDQLHNKPTVLSVNFGEIKLESTLKEKNTLLPRTMKDNIFYLNITNDNIIYGYYDDWYYNIDPMHGYVKTYERQLTKEEVEDILTKIKENAVPNLTAKIQDRYLPIRIEEDNKYIEKEKLQFILQDHEIIIEAFTGTITSIK